MLPIDLQRDWREKLTRVTRIRSRLAREDSGQAIAEFSLVIFLLVLVLFAILEVGLLNDKMVLMSTAREVARVCAVEGGKTQNALNRLRELLTADGIDLARLRPASDRPRPSTAPPYTLIFRTTTL